MASIHRPPIHCAIRLNDDVLMAKLASLEPEQKAPAGDDMPVLMAKLTSLKQKAPADDDDNFIITDCFIAGSGPIA